MGLTARYKLQYLDRADPLNTTRAVMQRNAETTEAALAATRGYVDQLVSALPGGRSLLGVDTDGTPYFDPAGVITDPAGLGLDTDGVPYFVIWDREGIL